MRTATAIQAEYGTENFGKFYPPTGDYDKPDKSMLLHSTQSICSFTLLFFYILSEQGEVTKG